MILSLDCVRKFCRFLRRRCIVNQDEVSTDTPQGKTLISISIDVAGSTEAKSRILAIAAQEGWRHQLYKDFYRQFLFAEDRFYSAILRTNPGLRGIKLDWQRLFVVKGIGDEIWLLYEVTSDDSANITAATV